MTQKVFVKFEKYLSCDLKPGDLFITEDPSDFNAEMNDLAVIVMLRTNEEADDVKDNEIIVHKLIITIVDREAPAPPKLDPHAPPGMKQ